MKAVRLHEVGGPQNLRVEEIESPVPAAGETLVRVRTAAFNRRDVFITQGLYPGISLPRTLGSDGAGVHEKSETHVVIDPMLGWGSNPHLWAADASILGMPHDGTFAQYVSVPKLNVYPKPPHLSMEEAAAIPLAGLTAYRAVFTRGQLQPGETVLIPGIGGGVQTFVLLFAKAAGARTVVTSGSEAKLDRARALGADVTINYKTSENWSKDVRAQSGGGPTLVIDSIGGETFAKALDIARPGARVVIYGGTTGDAKIRPFSIFWKQLDVLGTSMGSPADFSAMLRLFAEGTLEPAIDEVVDLAAVPAAAQRVLDGEQFGKVVVRVAG